MCDALVGLGPACQNAAKQRHNQPLPRRRVQAARNLLLRPVCCWVIPRSLAAESASLLLLLKGSLDASDDGVQLGLAVDEALALGLLGVHESLVADDLEVARGAWIADEADLGLDALGLEDLLQETFALTGTRPVPSAATVLDGHLCCRHGFEKRAREGRKLLERERRARSRKKKKKKKKKMQCVF
eukprot:INCI1156.1.p1 GENE.INCI1156.1~~INCI1156.1.p1  ORF type:complete len:186 (+),score=27.07 INCI1156.1:277-834(+)